MVGPPCGRILLQGSGDLCWTAQSLIARHFQGIAEESVPNAATIARPGDLLLDLGEKPDVGCLTWCQARDVGYLSSYSVPAQQTASERTESTAILGHGAFTGLIYHFLRVAIRDISHKIAGRMTADARRAEISKLLGAGNFGRLAMLSGITRIYLVGAGSRSQVEVAGSVADFLTVRERGHAVYRPRVQSIRPSTEVGLDSAGLGVFLRGPTLRGWWTGSRLERHQAEAHVPGSSPALFQDAVGILAGISWWMKHPKVGAVYPWQMGYEEVLEVALPYLGSCESRPIHTPESESTDPG